MERARISRCTSTRGGGTKKSKRVPSPDVRFSDLADDLRRLLERREHFCGLLPPKPDVLRLGEQRADLIGLIE